MNSFTSNSGGLGSFEKKPKVTPSNIIIAMTMYNGLMMQELDENQVFFSSQYPCIHERLAHAEFGVKEAPNEHNRRVDQMQNFFYLMRLNWKDPFHEYKVMGTFLEVIMKSFDFKMEFTIHECIKEKQEICLIQAGFLDRDEENTGSLFTFYLSDDFENKAISVFITNFFKKRVLKFKKKRKEPEEFRINDFMQEERRKAKLYGLFLYVNKTKFLSEFHSEEDGLNSLQQIMVEFYEELNHLFEDRNTFLKYLEAQKNRARTKYEAGLGQNNDQLSTCYLKAERGQFFIKEDQFGVEILDFVHLKIWYDTSKKDLTDIIIKYLPDLEFDYASCSDEEYEIQKDRLSYVL